MTTETVLLILLIVLIVGVLPTWSYSRTWGYAPTGVLGALLVIIFIWAVAGNGNNTLSDAGSSLKRETQAAGQEIKELGKDTKRAIEDAVD